jgi:NADPH-dependent curcumin reductase
MVAGQIARIHGCHVVGIAGGPEKCRYLVAEIGFDAAIDYKTEDVRKAVRQRCPKGIDVYFDNVGGDILDAALANLGRHARFVIWRDLTVQQHDPGQEAEQLSFPAGQPGSMTGMVVYDYADRYPEATSAIAGWLAASNLLRG